MMSGDKKIWSGVGVVAVVAVGLWVWLGGGCSSKQDQKIATPVAVGISEEALKAKINKIPGELLADPVFMGGVSKEVKKDILKDPVFMGEVSKEVKKDILVDEVFLTELCKKCGELKCKGHGAAVVPGPKSAEDALRAAALRSKAEADATRRKRGQQHESRDSQGEDAGGPSKNRPVIGDWPDRNY